MGNYWSAPPSDVPTVEVAATAGEPLFTNLVLEGGGVRGYALCGALAVLHEKGLLQNIIRFAGSSAGAIVASALAIGYTAEELQEELRQVDWSLFMDTSSRWWPRPLQEAYSLMEDFGLYKGKVFHDWFGTLVAKKCGDADITLKAVKERFGKEVILTGSCITEMKLHYFSPTYTPDMPLRDAVRISMSIPLFFAPVRRGDCVLVDGGLLNNYPLGVFDGPGPYPNLKAHTKPSPHTLGIKLLNGEERPSRSIFHGKMPVNSLKDFAFALVYTMSEEIERLQIGRDYWARSVTVNTGAVQTTDFNITAETKAWLLTQGRSAAEEYLVKWTAKHGELQPPPVVEATNAPPAPADLPPSLAGAENRAAATAAGERAAESGVSAATMVAAAVTPASAHPTANSAVLAVAQPASNAAPVAAPLTAASPAIPAIPAVPAPTPASPASHPAAPATPGGPSVPTPAVLVTASLAATAHAG